MANGESLDGNGDWKSAQLDRNADSLNPSWKTESDRNTDSLIIDLKQSPSDPVDSLSTDWKTGDSDRNLEGTDWKTGQSKQNADYSTGDGKEDDLDQNDESRPDRNSGGFAGDWKTARLDRNGMEKFITLVKQHPVLYNMDMEGYKDYEKKEVIWKDVALQCNFKSERDAKQHWKKLRDGQKESIKRQRFPINQRTGRRNRNWKYQKQLEFLRPFLTQRMGQPQQFGPNVNLKPGGPRMLPGPAPTQVPSKPMPMQTKQEPESASQGHGDAVLDFLAKQDRDKHPLELFFSSMCESTKRLSPGLQAKVKTKLFEVVSQAEAQDMDKRW